MRFVRLSRDKPIFSFALNSVDEELVIVRRTIISSGIIRG